MASFVLLWAAGEPSSQPQWGRTAAPDTAALAVGWLPHQRWACLLVMPGQRVAEDVRQMAQLLVLPRLMVLMRNGDIAAGHAGLGDGPW